jgi:hypothetical protein
MAEPLGKGRARKKNTAPLFEFELKGEPWEGDNWQKEPSYG